MDRPKKIKFPAVFIEKQERNNKRERIEDYIKQYPEQIAVLADENILDPSNMESVCNIASMSEADYIKHVQGLFKAYLSRIGFAPKGEKKRIADNFNEMLERTKDAVNWLHGFMQSGYKFTTDKDGNVIPDEDGAYKKADEDTETPVNTAKLTEYYNLWSDVAGAWKRLNEFEEANGMGATQPETPVYFTREYCHQVSLGEMKPRGIIKNIADTEIFFEVFGAKFKR